MKLSRINPNPKPKRRLFRQTRVSNAMEAAFSAEIQKHGLSRTKALLMLVEQYNANPWPLDTNNPRHGDLFYTWAAFPAPICLADTFGAHCAAADVTTGEGLRQVVQRCLDTASGKLAWDRLATLLRPDARIRMTDEANLVKLLQSLGNSFSECDEAGQKEAITTQIVAAEFFNVRQVKACLDWGVPVNAQSKEQKNRTALHEAMWQCHGVELVELLLERGADPHIKDEDGKEPLELLYYGENWTPGHDILKKRMLCEPAGRGGYQ